MQIRKKKQSYPKATIFFICIETKDYERPESEFYYPDQLEFQEENEGPSVLKLRMSSPDADEGEGNSASQEEIETYIKEQKSENTTRKTVISNDICPQ